MVMERHHASKDQMQWSERDLFVLNVLGQQRALKIEHLPLFLKLMEIDQEKEQKTGMKSLANNIIERLQRAGLVTVQHVENADSWCWLTRRGLRYVDISSSWKRPSRAELPELHAANEVRLMLSEQYPHASWISRQQLRLSSHFYLQNAPFPTAELDLGAGKYIAIHVLLHFAGSDGQIARTIQQHLQTEINQSTPYYTGLWFYATSGVAERLRKICDSLPSSLLSGKGKNVQIFSYPLIPKVVLYHGHSGPVRCIDWSKDGKWIASVGEDQTLQVWEATSGRCHILRHLLTNSVQAVAWSTDSRLLATADGEGAISIWEAATGTLLSTTVLHTNKVMSLLWAPYPAYHVASCSIDGGLKVFDVMRNELLWKATNAHTSGVSTLIWSPDGTRMATGGTDARVKMWNAVTGKHLWTYKKHPHPITTLAWSPNTRNIASGSDNFAVQIWDSQSGKKLSTIWTTSGAPRSLKWSPDGTRLAWAGDDPVIAMYGTESEKFQTYCDHTKRINSLAWSPDGTMLASGSNDSTVHVFPVKGSKQ